ncbi:hypothetical protein B0H10DRAFT_2040251 [Mycena sp. CBHHK59/15]|nr:hypothetical protein B0H10DRAFT_2040251 [Mycena sp. CBHHK59/15]
MPTDTRFPRIAIVDIPGKGKGVIANERIPRGTLIVSEKPRITLLDNRSELLKAVSALSQDDLSFLLSFPCGPNEDPILGRLKHFTPCIGDDAAGLCPTICRVNHTCYSPKASPNSAYFWNVSAKQEELRAIKEIHEGQEIEVSYMEDIANYEDPLAHLHRKFGFECSCKGCTRPAAERRASKQRILAYNDFVLRLPFRFGQDNPLQILNDIETQILIVCEEGYTGEVGARAHDAFQLCAYYGDAASARQWEAICRDCHALYQGPKTEVFDKAQRLAARPQDFRAWGVWGEGI